MEIAFLIIGLSQLAVSVTALVITIIGTGRGPGRHRKE